MNGFIAQTFPAYDRRFTDEPDGQYVHVHTYYKHARTRAGEKAKIAPEATHWESLVLGAVLPT